MTSSIQDCKAAEGKRVRYSGTNGDEYNKKTFGLPISGEGICLSVHTGHGLCIMVRHDDGTKVCVDMGTVEIIRVKPCGNPDCSTSTGIHDGITHGWGELDPNGFWEYECSFCQNLEVLEEVNSVRENYSVGCIIRALRAGSREAAQREWVSNWSEIPSGLHPIMTSLLGCRSHGEHNCQRFPCCLVKPGKAAKPK